jgi:hypothetical protein
MAKELKDRRLSPFEIVEVENHLSYIRVTLNNGVIFSISSNPQTLHLSFSFADRLEAERRASNTIDINYKPYDGIQTN